MGHAPVIGALGLEVRMSQRLAQIALMLTLAGSSTAWAQEDDPEAGEVRVPRDTPASNRTPNAWGEGQGDTASDEWNRASSAPSREKSKTFSGESDHEKVVGRIGFGLLGSAEVPVGVQPGGGRTVDRYITAPVLGSRYWLTERVGVEAGIGFMFRGGSLEDSLGNKGDLKSRAFALHAGLPIALAWGEHYNLLAIPYAGLGFSKARDGRGNAATIDDVIGDGFLFEFGLRAGVEIQLGAIGLEGFALQLTGGLRLRVEKSTAEIPILDNDPATPPLYKVDSSEVVFATSPGSSLGAALTGCLAAIYYF